MPAPNKNKARDAARVLGAGKRALQKAIASPLRRRNDLGKELETAFNSCASQDQVNAILEGDIIPRLLMAHVNGSMKNGSMKPGPLKLGSMKPGSMMTGNRSGEIDGKDADRFAALPLQVEAPDLLDEVDRLLHQGISVEAIYLDLLAPAAGRLGEMWTSDECDFVDVTMGLWRLQEVMREVSLRSPAGIASCQNTRRALFCPIPGDVHSFGAQMIDEVFARAGWQSEAIMHPERRELLDCLARQPIDILGLTVSRDCPAAALASLIKAARSVAINPNMCVLVGGHTINQKPDLVAEAGADGTGVDARAALECAERLVAATRAQERIII